MNPNPLRLLRTLADADLVAELEQKDRIIAELKAEKDRLRYEMSANADGCAHLCCEHHHDVVTEVCPRCVDAGLGRGGAGDPKPPPPVPLR